MKRCSYHWSQRPLYVIRSWNIHVDVSFTGTAYRCAERDIEEKLYESVSVLRYCLHFYVIIILNWRWLQFLITNLHNLPSVHFLSQTTSFIRQQWPKNISLNIYWEPSGPVMKLNVVFLEWRSPTWSLAFGTDEKRGSDSSRDVKWKKLITWTKGIFCSIKEQFEMVHKPIIKSKIVMSNIRNETH